MPGMTDRDHFAAAALTGLVAQGDDPVLSQQCEYAYRIADAMLRERAKTNHDAAPAARAGTPGTGDTDHGAAPAARASVGRPRTDNADLPTCAGTGDTQEPVAWGVVYPNDEVAVIAFKRKDAEERATASDRVIPLYRRPPVTKPMPKEKRAEVCAEPLAWAAIRENGQPLWLSYDRSGAEGMVNGMAEVVPLYRKPTLTDAERDDICVWLAECLRQASTATEGCNEELAERWQGRAKRAAAMIERLGGEG